MKTVKRQIGSAGPTSVSHAREGGWDQQRPSTAHRTSGTTRRKPTQHSRKAASGAAGARRRSGGTKGGTHGGSAPERAGQQRMPVRDEHGPTHERHHTTKADTAQQQSSSAVSAIRFRRGRFHWPGMQNAQRTSHRRADNIAARGPALRCDLRPDLPETLRLDHPQQGSGNLKSPVTSRSKRT